jgi:hypothetical protein
MWYTHGTKIVWNKELIYYVLLLLINVAFEYSIRKVKENMDWNWMRQIIF